MAYSRWMTYLASHQAVDDLRAISAIPSRALRIPVWGLAVVLATFVAMSRLYRGMHHPLDIAGGVFVGVGAVVVLVFACRAAEAARARCGRHRNLTPASLEPERRSDGSN